MVTTIATTIDNNTVDIMVDSFDMCNFGIRSGFKKKTQIFSNSVKGNTFSKFEFITFKVKKAFLHDQYLLERYPRLGGQSRITYAVATISIIARFMKDILGVTKKKKKNVTIVK